MYNCLKKTIFILLFASLSYITFGQVIKDIKITGNKITKDEIILRELSFGIGDTIPKEAFQDKILQSKKNLRRTNLFVTINIHKKTRNNNYIITINIKERWYYWIYPILEHADRNFSSFIKYKNWNKINYGLSFEKHNLFGKAQFLKLKLRFGYRQQLGILYENPQLNNYKRFGFQFYADNFRQRKVAVYNSNDKQNYFYDNNKAALNEFRSGFIHIIKPLLTHRLRTTIELKKYSLSEVFYSNYSNYLSNNKKNDTYLNLMIQYAIDNRDDKFYPLSGYYLMGKIKKTGTGITKRTSGFLQFYSRAENYWKFFDNINYDIKFNLKWNFLNTKDVPYYLSEALGYDFYPRGYEYYAINGNGAFTFNQTAKYKIFGKEPFELEWMPINGFKTFFYDIYAFAFFDAAYAEPVENNFYDNSLPGKLLVSTGAGIDIKTYYDRSFGIHIANTNHKGIGIFVKLESPLYKNY